MKSLSFDKAKGGSTNEKNLVQQGHRNEKKRTFAAAKCEMVDSVAQQVEHNTFNVGVLGSSPSRVTKETAKRLIFEVFGGFEFYIPQLKQSMIFVFLRSH